MEKMIKKSIFHFCRFCFRLLTRHYSVYPLNKRVSPVVYVVHHQNLRGPILSMAWFNKPLRPWVLWVFCNPYDCFRQYYGYTFTKRFGMPRMLAAILAFPLSFIVSGLMSCINAIPVFRRSKSIIKTFRQSISALTSGENLLISPDIDYSDTDFSIKEMYDGFLELEKYYFKQTGKHLAFVPLYISKRTHCIYIGNAVYFKESRDFKKEKANVYIRLKQEFLFLETKWH